MPSTKSFSQPADQKTCPPSLCSFITLITYQFSLLSLLVLACLSASLCLLTLAFTLTYTGVDLSTLYIINKANKYQHNGLGITSIPILTTISNNNTTKLTYNLISDIIRFLVNENFSTFRLRMIKFKLAFPLERTYFL